MRTRGRSIRSVSALVLIAAVCLATSATAGPPATIGVDGGSSSCHLATLRQDDITLPDTYTGVAEGVIVAMASPPGTLSCEIRVNGATVAATPPSHGQGVLVTAGQVTFTKGDFDVVSLCTIVVWDVGYGQQDSCEESTFADVPAEEVANAVHPATSTFDGPFDPEPDTWNDTTHCSRAGLHLPANTCGAGFVTPISDPCIGNPDETTLGWWSSGTEFYLFDLHLLGNGVLEGTSKDGPVRYFMHVQAGTVDCGGAVPTGYFVGQLYAV